VTAIALVSAKGSPGVTTSAVLLAAVWPTPAVMLEADPAGGDLRGWYAGADGDPVLRADRGLVSLLSSHHGSSADGEGLLAGHVQPLPGGLPVVVGLDSPAQVEALRAQWSRLATAISTHEGDVLVDLGRCRMPDEVLSAPLLRVCRRTLLVCRPTVASVAHARDLHVQLRQAGADVEVLVIGSSSGRNDVSGVLGVASDLVHQLPADPVAAAGVAGQWTRRLDRSPLVAAARHLAGRLHERLHGPQSEGRQFDALSDAQTDAVAVSS
jgi:hypothetical protein